MYQQAIALHFEKGMLAVVVAQGVGLPLLQRSEWQPLFRGGLAVGIPLSGCVLESDPEANGIVQLQGARPGSRNTYNVLDPRCDASPLVSRGPATSRTRPAPDREPKIVC